MKKCSDRCTPCCDFCIHAYHEYFEDEKEGYFNGFNDGELNELKSMEHYEAKDKLLEMLDDRNNGLGTCWMCGYGTFGLWFDNEAAYLNVGTSCD